MTGSFIVVRSSVKVMKGLGIVLKKVVSGEVMTGAG